MKMVVHCVAAAWLIPCVVSAALPEDVVERFTAAQDAIDSKFFRGSYTMTVSSSVAKPEGGSRQTTDMEWSVDVDPSGVESRRLSSFIENGEDVTEKKRQKFEDRNAENGDEEGEDEDFLSPFGDDSDRYLFGSPQKIDGRMELSFEPARGHEEDEGITRGSMAWDAMTLDPLWLAIEVLEPPKPLRKLMMRLEFERVGDGVYLKRMITDGRAKVLLMKRVFHLEMEVSDVVPISP